MGQGQEPSLFGEMLSGGHPSLLLASLGIELVTIYMGWHQRANILLLPQ